MMPEGAAAWFAFDPSVLGAKAGEDPTRGLIEAGIRGLIANIAAVDGGGSRVVSGLLSPRALGAIPYRVCLMQFAASPVGERVEPDRPISIDSMMAVFEVRTDSGHEKFVDLVHAALADEKLGRNIGSGTEVAAEFAGGIKGVAFSREGEGEARRVEWCSTPKAFLVGVGKGSIDRWLTATQPRGTDNAEWYLHRKLVAESRGKTDSMFEAFIDMNALRRGAPDEFAYGRMGRLAAAWHLANGRVLMVHGRMAKKPASKAGESEPAKPGPPLLMVNATYSMRSENLGVCHNLPVTESAWPGDEAPMAAAGPCTMVVRADLEMWVGLALETWVALSPKGGLEATTARNRWMRGHLAALERVKARIGKWAVVNAGESVAAAVATTQVAALGKDRLEQDLREVCGSLSDSIRFDTGPRVWTLKLEGAQLDPEGQMGAFSWGLDGRGVVGAWSPGDLTDLRKSR